MKAWAKSGGKGNSVRTRARAASDILVAVLVTMSETCSGARPVAKSAKYQRRKTKQITSYSAWTSASRLMPSLRRRTPTRAPSSGGKPASERIPARRSPWRRPCSRRQAR